MLATLLPASFALAQDFGTAAVNTGLGGTLTSDDPRMLIGRIIQIILSLLGVIILGLIIYAGFLWMTSAGEEEKISQAKKILRNAVIGLVVTLSSWAIATFILSRLSGAINGTGVVSQPPAYKNIPSSGFGAIGACTVDSVYPANNQKDVARNTAVIVTFKETLGLDSVCVNASGSSCTCDNANCSLINPKSIRIFKTELGDACASGSCPAQNTNVTDVFVSTSLDKKTLVLTFLSFLGSGDSNTNYEVKLTGDLKKADGVSMFKTCSAPDLQWGFEVSTRIDLTPPQIIAGFLFPQPDNSKDTLGLNVPAKQATAEIFVNGCPKTYASPVVVKVEPAAEVVLDYHGLINKFKIVVPADSPNKAQLFNGNTNSLLGVADFNNANKVVFDGYFSIKTSGHVAGDSWILDIIPERLADTLTVGSDVYIFAESKENNNILVSPGVCNSSVQALNIREKLSGNTAVDVSLLVNKLVMTAKIGGNSGNSLTLDASNKIALNLTPFSGGADKQISNKIEGKKDNPMNSIIKINFNEAVNPLRLSGTASELASYIKVVNAVATSKAKGAACTTNADCRSYKCDTSVCVGDYVNGRFMVSGGYKTVEFISDNECGINGCGEKMYCLPPNSNLAVEINASNLKICASDQDCIAYSPFKTCTAGALGYKSCQDVNSRNYPSADLQKLDGITDTALNSLDGNRDTAADGPLSFYSDNFPNDKDKKDNYRFSFFVTDKIESTPPQITAILPVNRQSDIKLIEPIEIVFSTLMMSDTLRSGGKTITNGVNTVEHKFINLRSSEPTPLGYWVDSLNRDTNPLDGVADITVATIDHSPFLESFTYNTQVGSGVKDIYQNCFKPSIGPGCSDVTAENPSCCFGVATSTLSNGNCN